MRGTVLVAPFSARHLPARREVQRELGVQDGSAAARAVEGEPAAQGLGAVLQTDQPGPPGQVRPAGAVVADGEV